MKINKIKKAMGLGQIFGIVIVAIVAAFVINRIRASMSTAGSAHDIVQKKLEDAVNNLRGDKEENNKVE